MKTLMNHRARSLTLLMAAVGAVALAVLAGPTRASVAAQADTYVVIINAGNPYAESGDSAKNMIKQLYLKERAAWPGGAESKPYGKPGDSGEHAAFRDKVLGMTEAQLAQHWIDQKQKTGATPPREVSSGSMMLKFVAKDTGAFGVVTKAEASGAEGVKILFEFGG